MEFSEKIQKLRKEKHWTQEQLAEKLYISRTAISKWESGKGYPNIESLKDISQLFNITIDELLSCEEIINISTHEKKVNDKKTTSLIYGLFDIISVLFIFLPLYPYTVDNAVYSVSLINNNDLTKTMIILYIIMLSILTVIGIIEIVFYYIKNKTALRILITLSLAMQIVLIPFFAISRQAYLTLIIFAFFIIKMFIMIRNFNYIPHRYNHDTKSVNKNN